MTNKFFQKVLHFVYYFELIIAVMLIIALLAALVALGLQLYTGITQTNADIFGLSDFLGKAFSVIIGVEFLKMLIKQTPGSVIEILLFSIARQLVVEHASALEYLLCIIGIAILFGIRKYLYVSTFDEKSKSKAQSLPVPNKIKKES